MLLDKGHVTRRKVGKAFHYKAATREQTAFRSSLREMIEAYRDGPAIKRESANRGVATDLGNRRLSLWRVAVAACMASCLLLGIGAVALVPSRAEEPAEKAPTTESEKANPIEDRRENTVEVTAGETVEGIDFTMETD